MKKFIYKILSILLLPFILITSIYIIDIKHEFIAEYQLSKLSNFKDIDYLFLGDSSCGNSIDCIEFDNNCINLSLNGGYGIKGSLDMLSILIGKNIKVKNLFVMHTLDVFPRRKPTFNLKLDDYKEIEKISINYKKIKNNLFKINNKVIKIENDYVKQSEKIKSYLNTQRNFDISFHNKYIIDSIQSICNKQNIKLIFLFGPNTCKNCEKSQITNYFINNGISFLDNFYELDNKNIGDNIDHVILDYKKESTGFYKQILIQKFPNLFLK